MDASVAWVRYTAKIMRVLIALAVAIPFVTMLPSATAGKPVTVPPFALYQESYADSSNPTAPGWCLNEDDFAWRRYYGRLDGSSSTTFRLCDPSVDYSPSGGQWWDAGGEGVFVDLEATGTLTDMTVTAPDGTATHGVLVGRSTYRKVTTYRWQACVVPHYFVSSDTSDTTLAGGTYTATLTGSFPEATWTTWVGMATVDRQLGSCPVEQRNLSP